MKWTELQCEGAASATNLLGRGQGIALVHMFIKELTLYIYIYICAMYICCIYIYVIYIYAIYIYMLYIYIYELILVLLEISGDDYGILTT